MTSIIIQKQVVRVEKLVGERNKFRQVAFKKKLALDEKKRFDEREKKIEDRQNETEKQVSNKIPVARLGILDVIKNFIFQTLLGAFVIKILPQLPKLKDVLSFGLKATDFLVSFSGKILNAFVTSVDKVYQIVDFGKQQAKLLGGDKGLQNYNKSLDLANKVMNSMFIAAMLFSDLAESDSRASIGQQAVGFIKDRVVERGAQQVAQQAAIRGAAQISTRAAAGAVAGVGLLSSALGEGAFQLRKFTNKIQKDADLAFNEAQNDKNPFMRFIKTSFYGAFVRPGMMFTNFLLNGLGTLLDVIGAPFRYAVELINFGIMFLTDDVDGMKTQRENLGKFDARIREQIREMVNTLSFGTLAKNKGSFGSLFGNEATKAMGYASGGEVTRGGEVVGGTIGRTLKRQKVSRVIEVPTAPLIPGVDAGGLSQYAHDPTTKNIDAFFPNPKDPKYVNPNQLITRSYGVISNVPFLSPLLEASIKILMGDLPSSGDYNAIGTSLNNFINTLLDKTAVPGKKTAVSDEIGSIDISSWARKAAEDSIASSASSILSNLEYQFSLKKSGGGDGPNPSAQKGPGAGDNPLAQFAGEAQFVIGDSIAHGFAGRSGNGSNDSDTKVGRKPAEILEILRSKGESLKGSLIDLSTGIANNSSDIATVEAQLSYLKSIGARVRVLGVGNQWSQKNGDINSKLKSLVSKYGFYFYGGFDAKDDKLGVHGTPSSYEFLKQKRETDTAPTKGSEGRGGLETGKGYGSAGGKIAGELGRFIYQKLRSPQQFQAITEHPEFGGVRGTHADGSYHYEGRAIDIGAYTREQAPILKVISEFNLLKGVKPVELLHGKNASGHSDHVHVAYKEGGPVSKTDYALTHPREYIIDADSVKSFGGEFYDLINQVETISQRKNAAEILIQILSQYTEDGYPETEDDYTYYIPQQETVTVLPPQIIMTGGLSGGSGGGYEDPSQDNLFM